MRHAETIIPARTGASSRLAFIAATTSVVAVFAAVGATIPLFNIYRAADGVTTAGITMAVVAYSVATLGTLLIFGRVSNHLGRKPPSLAALGLMISGSLLLMTVHGVGVLICGRLLMGLGAGLASTSLTAYIVDTAPARPVWLPSVASSQSVMLGLAIGATASGTMVQYAPWPRTLSLWAATGLLFASTLLVALSPETTPRKPGAWGSLRPILRSPACVRPLLPGAAVVLLATWATGAFYQAFVPGLVQHQLHSDNFLTVGFSFAAYMGSSALGAPLSSRFSTGQAQRIAMVTFLAAWVGIVTSTRSGHLVVFFGATMAAGVSQGVAISGVTQGLLRGVAPSERAPVMTVVYLLSYTSATVPSLVAARLSTTVSLSTITWGYAGLVLMATAALFAAHKSTSATTTAMTHGAGPGGERNKEANGSLKEMTAVTAFAEDLNNLHHDIAQRLSLAENARPDAKNPRAHYSAIDTFLAMASRHNAAMVSAIEPLLHHLPAGHDLAHEFLAASRTYEEALAHVKAKLYGSSYVDRPWSSIWIEVHERFEAVSDLERRMVNELRDGDADVTNDDGSDDLGARLHDAELSSPTRPHPWIPHHGVAGRLARAVARRVDRFWDATEGRMVPAPLRPHDREHESKLTQYLLADPHIDDE